MGSLRSSFRARRRVPRTLVRTFLSNDGFSMSIVHLCLRPLFGLDRLDGPSLPDELLLRFSRRTSTTILRVPSLLRRARTRVKLESLLEENARANPDARIRPLTHVSVDRAYQAKSVGSNSLLSILIAIRRSLNL